MALNHDGISSIGAPVEVRRHAGARRLTLRVSRTRRAVIVTLPPQCDVGEAGQFLIRNIGWVRERLDNLPRPVPFRHGISIPLRGAPHRVIFLSHRAKGGIVLQRDGDPIPELCVTGRAEHAPRRLLGWLNEQARQDLDTAVGEFARRLKVRPKRIAVRDQSSRWGSCSTTGVLSFSWRLILAPPEVLRYVAAHEVAHMREMNHGPKFWAHVRALCPDIEHAKHWLRLSGMDLHRYG